MNIKEIKTEQHLNITEVYQFLYTDCIYDGAMSTLSLHRTKKGAYRAMRDFLEIEYAQWREDGIRYGKQEFKFGTHCVWSIRPIELKD